VKNNLLFTILLLTVTAIWAREVRIYIEDRDLEWPLEGAVIRSWDGSDYICDEDGQALVSVPDDRQVIIQVSYPGYETGRLVIPLRGNSFSLGLHLGGAIHSRELVIEAQRPGVSETRSGRSVAISGEILERSSKIGVIEDVMTSIKLLPGVGYSGMFNALPSIRGGFPGDLMAALDGFYIENPYHWGGGFSIFDPNMIASAQLSHGIFSTRYGHTVSGLLEVSSKKASPDYAELDLGLSTSAVNLNAALPLGGNGGFMLMGRVTYWDPFIWALKQLSKVWDNETLQMVNAVTTAPYIRSGAASLNYRFNSDIELNANAFIGTDGVGADYLNENSSPEVSSRSHMIFEWENLQAFLIAGLTWNPKPTMLVKATVGGGYEQIKINGLFEYDYLKVDNPPYKYELYGDDLNMNILATQTVTNFQGRLDYDWSLGQGFLLAAGIQELFRQNTSEEEGQFFLERRISGAAYGIPHDIFVRYPVKGIMPEVKNQRYNSSAYILGEYTSPEKRFGTELGLRVDHLYFTGKDFNIQTMPVLNPRLNLDFNVFRNKSVFESLDLTFGTGLFSSMNDAIAFITPDNSIGDFELKPNRSWTSVVGVKSDFSGGWSFNVEGYFKYVYDRAYQYMATIPGEVMSSVVHNFSGEGIVWGFDFMLQKFENRYWDGWLSYTFTHARYHEPERPIRYIDPSDPMAVEDRGWYYPFFHRFHNANMVLNFKPIKDFNIYTRLGLASGRPKVVPGEINAYDVMLLDENGKPKLENGSPIIIQKYKRTVYYSDDSRTTWSVPLDIKLSYYIFNPRNKVQTEIYLAAENLLSLVYVAQANTSFNQYTGKEDTGSDSANYEMPVPMVSVGLKWSY
jgi:hypothetical protein